MQRLIDAAGRWSRPFPAILLALCLTAGCSTDSDERRISIYGLRSAPTADNVQRIRGWLDDPDRDVRATALNALVGLGVEDSLALARRALDDEDGFVRATAAKLLGDLGDETQAAALGQVLTLDPDPTARQRAAESLERIGGPVAIKALTRGLRDPMERVRKAAVQGVSGLDASQARVELERLLREDAVWEIRAEAAYALGLTGHPEALPGLEAALQDPNEFVRAAAANAMRLHGEVSGLQDR